MKTLNRSQQNFLKTIHLISASTWMTCIIVITLMPHIAKSITNGDELYMYNRIFHFIDMKMVTPAAVTTLITGLIYSIFTKWGFFKHGWLIYKWVITLGLILVGTFYLGPMVTNMLEISEIKRIAALEDPYYQYGLAVGSWVSILNTSLLIIAVIVSVYKPWKNVKK
jgi:uncharacterized membrane protein